MYCPVFLKKQGNTYNTAVRKDERWMKWQDQEILSPASATDLLMKNRSYIFTVQRYRKAIRQLTDFSMWQKSSSKLHH